MTILIAVITEAYETRYKKVVLKSRKEGLNKALNHLRNGYGGGSMDRGMGIEMKRTMTDDSMMTSVTSMTSMTGMTGMTGVSEEDKVEKGEGEGMSMLVDVTIVEEPESMDSRVEVSVFTRQYDDLS